MRRLFGEKCLLDTNVLVYALDRASRYFAQASAVLVACADGRVAGHIAQQNLLELLHVLTVYYRVPAGQALSDARAFAQHPRLTVIAPAPQTITSFFGLAQVGEADTIEVFDCYLAATMQDNGLSKIVTANTKDFLPLPGIEVIDLRSLAPAGERSARKQP